MTEDTLSSNATVTSENTLQADELIQLIEGNQETAVKDYLQTAGEQAKVICSTAGSKGLTPIHSAAFSSQEVILTLILETGVNADTPLTATVRKGVEWFDTGTTPLHIACARRNTDVIRLLLSQGASHEATDSTALQTPLHIAAEHGQLQNVKLLVEAGADVDAKDNMGETAVHKATRHGHSSVISLLIMSQANVNMASSNGQTALLLSVKEGHLKSVILFLENGADPLCSDEDNNSILSVAIINQHDDIIPLLLDHDVDMESKNSQGMTSLHWACKLGQGTTVSLLLEVECKLNSQTETGQTALHLAAGLGHADITRQLVIAGANKDILDSQGRTAVDFSMNQECAEIIKSGGSTSSHHPPISDETGDLKPVYIERQMSQEQPQVVTPKAPATPRQSNGGRSPRALHVKQPALQPVMIPYENTQFNHPIAVDRQTVDTLRQKVSTLESQILTLSLGDDKAVRLYRQFGKLLEEMTLARQVIRGSLNNQSYRPLTPRMENNSGSQPSSTAELPSPRFLLKKESPRKFNPNFMVETCESLKSELRLIKNELRPTQVAKFERYSEQIESMSLAVVTFAHQMAVTMVS